MKRLLPMLTLLLISTLTFGQPGYTYSGSQHGPMGKAGMSPYGFEAALQSVVMQNSDFAKLDLAKDVVENHDVTSRQVLRLIHEFSFDRYKLRLAKFSYAQVMDPANFFVVNSAFAFEGAVRELDQFIQAHPRMTSHIHHEQLSLHGGNASGGIVHHGVANVCSHGNSSCNRCGMGPAIMSNRDFQILINSIAARSFDSSRLFIAKQGVRQQDLSAAQIAHLMLMFTFDCNRLEFAKFAYRSTVDKRNYFLVNNSLTFNSSVRDLERFLMTVG